MVAYAASLDLRPQLRDLLASAYDVLGLKACTTAAWLKMGF